MFSYFGSKSKIVGYYPKPKYDKIIEPFAGSARYALEYYDRDVTILDKYEVIVGIWKYLQQASPNDILSLPNLPPKTNIDTLTGLCDEEKWLIYYCTARGNGYVGKISGSFNNWHTDKEKIAKNLFKIRHWNIVQGTYEDIQNQEATWYIDPPYQHVTRRNYKHSKIDYDHLGEYCKDRLGQVIVCENTAATWLPFDKLIDMHGLVKWTNEAIWLK